MKKMRSVIALVLAMLLLITAMPMTASAAPMQVTEIALNGVVRPYIGAHADFDYTSYIEGYSAWTIFDDGVRTIGGVSWYDYTTYTNVTPDDVFIEGHQYTMYVYLKANSGYRFRTDGTGAPKVDAMVDNSTAYVGKLVGYDPTQYVRLAWHFSAPVAEYPIKLGGKDVTYSNRNNILGDGKAKFDPASWTLTLNNPKFDAASTPFGMKVQIFAYERDITLKGKYETPIFSNYRGDCALYALDCSVTCEGEFEFWGDDYGVYAERDFTVKSGSVYCNSDDVAIRCLATLTVCENSEGIRASGDNCAIGTEKFYPEGDVEIIKPEGGYFSGMEKAICEKGGAVAKEAVVKREVYPIWLGKTQVTYKNKDDILGDGEAKYLPDESRLVFYNNPKITGVAKVPGTSETAKIYCGTYTIIECYYLNDEAEATYGVYGTDIILDGVLKIKGKSIGTYTESTLQLHDASTLTSGGKYYGVYSNSLIHLGEGSKLIATATENYGVYTKEDMNLSYDFGVLEGTSSKAAGIYADGEIYCDDAPAVVLPSKGKLGKHTVFESDNSTKAKHARLETNEEYPIWLGDTRVTAANREDIFGDGTASYDPFLTYAITLNNPKISGGHGLWTGRTAKIYIDSSALVSRIDGSYKMTEADCDYGIFVEDESLELRGDFTILGKEHGTYTTGTYGSQTFSGNILVKADQFEAVSCSGTLHLPAGLTKLEAKTGSKSFSAIYAKNQDIMTKHIRMTVPEGGKFNSDGDTVDSKGNLAQRVVFSDSFFELWLGNKEVTKANASDIFGDGKAKFDFATNTLTLNNPTIPGVHYPVDSSFKICSNGIDLTIKGTYKMQEADAAEGVINVSHGSLYLNGAFLLYGKDEGVWASKDVHIQGGNVTVKASDRPVTARNCVYVEKDVNRFEANATNTGGIAIVGGGTTGVSKASNIKLLVPSGGKIGKDAVYESDNTTKAKRAVFAKSLTVSFDANGGSGTMASKSTYYGAKLTLPECTFTAPANKKFAKWDKGAVGDQITVTANTTIKAVWADDISYKLWLGSTEITKNNYKNIFGDGKASYDPSSATITLKSPTISGVKTLPSGKTAKIANLSGEAVTISGTYKMSTAESDYGYYGENYGSVYLKGNLTIIGKLYGVYAVEGGVAVTGGSVVVKATECEAIRSTVFFKVLYESTLEASTASTTHSAVYAKAHDDFKGDVRITVPENGKFNSSGNVVNSSNKPAQKAVFTCKYFDLWVGSTQVTKSNAGNILGDGKAKFDFATNTLTLSDPVINGVSNPGDYFAVIYARGIDLTIKGSYKMNNYVEKGEYAVSVLYGNLILDGNFTFKGTVRGVSATEKVIFRGGKTVVSAKMAEAVGAGQQVVLEKTFNRLEATSDGWRAINVWIGPDPAIKTTDMKLVTPSGGSIKGPTVCESDGTTDAKKVVFARICKLSFDANGGSGTMAAKTLYYGASYTLPACTFTPPANKEFDKWDKGAVGAKITVTANTTVKAIWKDKSSGKKILLGDLNGNGKVNNADYQLLARYVLGWPGAKEKITVFAAGDLNQNGKVNSADYQILARYVLGWPGYDKYIKWIEV